MHTISAQRQGLPHPHPHPHQHPSPRLHQRAVADRQAGKQTKPSTSASPKVKLYNPRHPEQTLLYRTVAEHFETWLELASCGQFDGQGDLHTPSPYCVELAFRKYLQCGIFANGFASSRCEDCWHDYFVAFSCKGRGVCPSCHTRRMAETAAHFEYSGRT